MYLAHKSKNYENKNLMGGPLKVWGPRGSTCIPCSPLSVGLGRHQVTNFTAHTYLGLVHVLGHTPHSDL